MLTVGIRADHSFRRISLVQPQRSGLCRVAWKALLLMPVIALMVPCAYATTPLAAVNEVRFQAGLRPLVASDLLDEVARGHATYLGLHRQRGAVGGVSAHLQQPGRAAFSGERPGDRAINGGYPHRIVRENVSMGYPNLAEAVSGLMSAIYHRFTFLDWTADELGAHEGERARVLVLGRRDLATLCTDPPAGSIAEAPMDCLGTAMTQAGHNAMCAHLPPAAVYRPPHPFACPDGSRLDADYMAAICASPPQAARFDGDGYYFQPCANGTQVRAEWLRQLCASPPAEAAYPWSGEYFVMCGERAVRAEWLKDFCTRLPTEFRYSDSGIYRQPCAEPHDIRLETLDGLDAQARDDLPDVLLWPPDGGRDIPPAFFVEEPDPLPDIDVSGYPVSMQFNPTRVDDVELRLFRLSVQDAEGQWQPIEQTRLMNEGNDPARQFGPHDFALFPLQRLKWGARYRVEADFDVDGEGRHLLWTFETAGKGEAVVTVAPTMRPVAVDAARPFLVFVPPLKEQPHTVLNTRYRFQHGDRVTLDLVDPNTLRVTLSGTECGPVMLSFDDGREVELRPRRCRV